uniref:RcnB family protein n=1 Tax=Altererythrobacter segetis TaxID=1104773 RepID=UPI00140B5649|nr:RcnB family protein [Altererythrobacter segetis]
MQFKFFTGGALAAVAATLALTAVPASAREADRHDDRGRHQQETTDNGQQTQRWGGRDQPTARPDRAAPQAQRQRDWTPQAREQQPQQRRTRTRQEAPQQVQRQQQRGWAQRGTWSDPAQQRQQAQAQQTQRWAGNDQRAERNRTYVDRERTTTYGTNGSNWRDRRSGSDGNWRDNRRGDDSNWRDNRNGSDRNWRDGDRDGQRWDRNWRSSSRYDWQRYRTTNRNAYHIGRYYAPYRNYSYRRLGIGFSLNSLFYSDRYWINDPWQYRLPDVYGPYRWVRYYDDALLVDIYSGEVVDVIYDFFW